MFWSVGRRHDSQAIRRLNGIDLTRKAAPDATTLLKFRRLLEEKQLTAAIFDTINAHLADKGLALPTGTIIDATLIAAPSSTKNQDRRLDPDMVSGDESEPRTTKKGKHWHFGMKAHIGVDAESMLVHTAIGTAANVNEVTQAHGLLHGEETDVFGDAGDQGVDQREENQGVAVTWHMALRQVKRRALPKTPWGGWMEQIEQVKARMGPKVEHPFHVVKMFHHRKTCYRGLSKNTRKLFTLFGLANLVLARRWLLAPDGQGAS